LYCQRAFCSQIVAAGGDYVVIVKGNQPRLQQDVVLLFEEPPQETTFAFVEQRDRHGDRHEVRRVWMSGELNGYLDWPGAHQVGKIERVVHHKGKIRSQVRYFVTSLQEPDPYLGVVGAGPAHLLKLIRGHWAIENRLHYVRDVSFGEDASQVRSGTAPQVLAALRNAVIGLLRDAGWINIAAGLRYNAWRPGAALQLLGLAAS
jgi:predicted transposase YbfD/YdcC